MTAIPYCAPANPFILQPKVPIPKGAIDTHAHVFSSTYPYVNNRTYTPPDATVGSYLHLHKQLGINHGVLVQPSVYGTDNQLHLDALLYLKSLGLEYKGVAVVDANVSDFELDRLQEAGFCGVRLNLLFKGGIDWHDIERLATRLAMRNWHFQFLVDVSNIDDLYDKIRRLPIPVVFDHLGHIQSQNTVHNLGFKALLKLQSEGRVWTKLSAPYRLTSRGAPYQDVAPFAQALISANAERCLWGSDWPHPCFSADMPEDSQLLNALWGWLDHDNELYQQVLVSNPRDLYQFSS